MVCTDNLKDIHVDALKSRKGSRNFYNYPLEICACVASFSSYIVYVSTSVHTGKYASNIIYTIEFTKLKGKNEHFRN